MRNYVLPVAARLLAFIAPLFFAYLYARSAFEYARTQERHGDTGLGIAILLGFMTFVMLGVFLIDLVIQIRKRRPSAYLTDAFIVVMLLMPFGWFACSWFGLHNILACRIPMAFFSQVLSWL
jgi:uncharacterized protein YqhQ